jgi:polar amino acid transport system substrate-binding protein
MTTVGATASALNRENRLRTNKLASLALAGSLAALAACGSSTTSASGGAASTAAGAATTVAASGGGTKIDKCDVTGTSGSIKLEPAVAGQFTLLTSLPAPGWFNGDDEASVKDGYEYCMAANIAHRAGLTKVVLKNVNFDQLVLGTLKDYDLALAESSITAKRAEVVDFTEPYFASDIGLIAKKDKAASFKDTASLKDAVIGVQESTTGATFLQEKLAGKVKEFKVFPDAATMFTAITAGQVDLVGTDTSIVQEQEKKAGGALVVVGQYKTGESYGGILPKGSKNKAAIDTAIKAMQSEGVLGKLSTTYLSGDPSKVPVFTA